MISDAFTESCVPILIFMKVNITDKYILIRGCYVKNVFVYFMDCSIPVLF